MARPTGLLVAIAVGVATVFAKRLSALASKVVAVVGGSFLHPYLQEGKCRAGGQVLLLHGA